MIYQTIVAFAVLASSAVGSKLFSEDPVVQKYMFDSFKREYGFEFSTMEEEQVRFQNFVSNLKAADERNEAELKVGGSAVHGITKMSALSEVEFRKRYLGSDVNMKAPSTNVLNYVPPYTGVETLVDWTGKYTTAVKDQGYCGSCWAFSAAEQIESDAWRTLGVSTLLSPQQITSCDSTSYGCDGGWTENAYNYVKRAGGIESNADYPYTSYQGVTGTCKATASKYIVGVDSYTTVNGETNMANYVKATGPLSVCVDASTWNSYRGGIMSSCGRMVNHCVQAVGVDATAGGYWKVRNSWGTSWGESGYIRLAYGQDTCHITNDPTYVKVHKV